MWPTADGYLIALPATAGLPPPAAAGLVRAARLTGVGRQPDGGRRLVFHTARGGRAYRLVVRPTGVRRGTVTAVRPVRPAAERSDGHGHQLAQTAIVRRLLRAGLRVQQGDGVQTGPGIIRHNRQQVVSRTGRANPKQRPDVSYVAADGQRVNVEIDTDRASGQGHLRAQVAADPDAHHVALWIDALTGRVRGRWVYDPAAGTTRAEPPSARLPAPPLVGRPAPAPAGPRVTFARQRRRPTRAVRLREAEADRPW